MDSKYNSLSEWRKADPKAYNNAFRKGNLPDICKKFGWFLIPNRKIKIVKELEEIVKVKNNSNIVLKRFYEKLKFIVDNELVCWITNHPRVISNHEVTLIITENEMKSNNKDFWGIGCYFWDYMDKNDKSFALEIQIGPSNIINPLISLVLKSDLSNNMDEEYQKHFKKEIKKYNEIVDNFIKASKSKSFNFKF